MDNAEHNETVFAAGGQNACLCYCLPTIFRLFYFEFHHRFDVIDIYFMLVILLIVFVLNTSCLTYIMSSLPFHSFTHER